MAQFGGGGGGDGAPPGASLFDSLEDSPFMRKQLTALEEGVGDLRERSARLTKAARKYKDALADVAEAERTFAGALDAFGAGCRPAPEELLQTSVAAMSLLSGTLRELAGFTEALKLQTDSVLVEQLSALERGPLDEVKALRKMYDKRLHSYDAARGRYLGLVRETKAEVLAAAEEELGRKKARFDGARFALAAALQRAHTARRCAYAEAVAAAAAAHAAFFSAGDDAASALTARTAGLRAAAAAERGAAARAQALLAQRAAALQTPPACAALAGGARPGSADGLVTGGVLAFADDVADDVALSDDDLSPRHSSAGTAAPPPPATSAAPEAPLPFGAIVASERSRRAAAAMAAANASGTVAVLKQGYLLKQSHSLYAHWKRRYFVLDSRGDLRYFRDEEHTGGGLLDRLGGRTPRNASTLTGAPAASAAAATVSLLTSTVKRDGGDAAPGHRFCFRVVSPAKEYTLQADSAAEQNDWMEAIAGVISELLCSSRAPAGPAAAGAGFASVYSAAPGTPGGRAASAAAALGGGAPPLPPSSASKRLLSGMRRSDSIGSLADAARSSPGASSDGGTVWDFGADGGTAFPSPGASPAHHGMQLPGHRRARSAGSSHELASPASLLRGVAGNARCADCGAGAPDWASLNLSCLLCLHCSGEHRALGVHVSKVRSLALDTRVWDPAVMAVMAAGGNAAVNAVLEADAAAAAAARPAPGAGGEAAAAFIRAKYAQRAFVAPAAAAGAAAALSRAVAKGDTAAALAALLAGASPDAAAARSFSFVEREDCTGGGAGGSPGAAADAAGLAASSPSSPLSDAPPRAPRRIARHSQGGADSPTAMLAAAARAAAGRSLLHCAAADGAAALTELLLLHGARCDPRDADGRTPLHLAAATAARSAPGSPAAECARRLLRAGAEGRAADAQGLTPAQLAADVRSSLGSSAPPCDAALEAALREAAAPPVPPPAQHVPASSSSSSAAALGDDVARASPGGKGRHRKLGSRDFIEGLTRELGSMFNRSGSGSGGGAAPLVRSSSDGAAAFFAAGGLPGSAQSAAALHTQREEMEALPPPPLLQRRTYSMPRPQLRARVSVPPP